MAIYSLVLGDLGPVMPLTLTLNGSAYPLNAGTDTAVLRYETPGGETMTVTAAITDAAAGEVEITWSDGDLPDVGAYRGQVEVARDGDTTFPRTFPNDGAEIVWFVNRKI